MQTPPPRRMPLPSPDGCRSCGLAYRGHFQRWTPDAHWHSWIAPTDAQRLARMRARRAARISRKAPADATAEASVSQPDGGTMSTPDSTRRDLLDGHHALLKLAEQIPEIPLKNYVRLNVTGGDAEGLAALDQLAAALGTHHIDYEDTSDGDRRRISFRTGLVTTVVTHVLDRGMQKHYERMSYIENIVLTAPAGAV